MGCRILLLVHMARLVELTLNGRSRVDAVPDNLLLLDYLREIVGLTGTKTGCDGGECGACTVLVDDQPRLSCLTLAAAMDGRRVETVESLGSRRAPFRGAARLSREARLPMRLLHAGLHHGLGRAVAPKSPPERAGDPRSAGQQYLPLHRLRQNHRSREIRRRAARRRGMRRERDRARSQHRRLRADDRRAGKGLRAGEIHS